MNLNPRQWQVWLSCISENYQKIFLLWDCFQSLMNYLVREETLENVLP